MAASLLLCMGFASCSQDDMPQTGGTPLPDGEYPLAFTARVDGMATRSTGKDEWAEGDKIGVRIGADGATGCYELNHENGTVKESITPVYWQSTAPATVTAWYPFEAPTAKNIANQSNGYGAIDFLKATAENKKFNDKVELNFIHQMAKVKCVLLRDASIKEEEFKGAKAAFYGYTSASFDNGELTGTDNDWITPTTADCEALLVPQNMTGKPLIKVSVSDNDFIYTPVIDEAGNLQAGYLHTFTITVKADGIEVTSVNGGEWNDGGSVNVNSYVRYIASDLKLGDYYYADGTWSDGGLRKLYADGTMEWATTTPQPESGKTCIGIVFYTGQHETDQSNYASTGIGQEKCHGYVVALTDATSDYCMWGVYGTELGCYPTDAGGNKQNNYSNPDIDWSGYAWTQKIITAAEGKDKLNATEDAGYPATWYAVVSYETGCNAPSNSSGWFLPSIGQMRKISQNRSSLFGSVSGADDLKSDWYWSSSEYYGQSAARALYVNVGNSSVGDDRKGYSNSYVRPVLAF